VASLRPVLGPPREILPALRDWLGASSPPPLAVRTSGSTGEAKDVLLGRDAMVASARATHDRLGGPGHWLLVLPPDHVAGLQVLSRSVLGGTEVVFGDEHARFADAVAALPKGRRYVSLVPTQLRRYVEEGGQTLDALRAFDAVLVGGAGVPPALLARARDAGVPIVTTYGMSETCGGCVYDGRPLDGVRVAVERADGSGPASDGRILLGGPVLFDGYGGRPELTAQVMAGDMLRTQDLGHVDADGRLVVSGRIDDVVMSGGVNVALSAVEARVREHPQVKDAAVVGMDDPEWGSRVVAYAVADERLGLQELRDFVAERLPRTWAPRDLVAVPELPLLPNGKVDRQALRSSR
jgi:O-succinylbenzoic acid--CoA ligase